MATGRDHERPFHMTATPTLPGPVAPTAAQKLADAQETADNPPANESTSKGALQDNEADTAPLEGNKRDAVAGDDAAFGAFA